MKVRELIAKLQEEDPEAFATVVHDEKLYCDMLEIVEVLGKVVGSAHSYVAIFAESDE